MSRVLGFIPVLLLASIASAFAQGEQAGAIRGRLTSSDGLALPGVAITVESPALQGTRSTTSDVNGNFLLAGLPAGDYAVKLELQGFASQDRHVTVPLASAAVIDAALSVARISESVDVKAALVQPAAADPGRFNLRVDQTRLLPVGRTPFFFAELAPGLTDNTPNANQVTIGGGFAYDNVFLVDGVDVNDNVFGQPNPLYIEEGIQEVQVASSGVGAEYGRFGGGVINVITQSGGNLFSGSFRTNLTNSAWSTETPFERAKGITRPSKVSPTYEAVAGGPVMKDRLWYFGGVRVERTSTANTLPQTGVAYEGQNNNRRYEAKLTGSLAANETLQGTFIDSRTDQYAVSHPASIDPAALTKPITSNRLGVATWRGALGRVFATAQYSQKFWEVNNNGGTSTNVYDSPFLTRGTTSGVPANLEYHAPYFDSTDPDARNNRQATATLSYLLGRKGFGSHELKTGGEYFVTTRRTGNSQTSTGYIFQTDYKLDASGKLAYDANGNLIPVFTPGTSRLASWYPTRGAAIDVTTVSWFASDRWSAGSRFTFDLGLRYEHVGTQADAQSQAVRANTLMPRLGATYALTGDARTTVSATFGTYSGTYNDVQFSRNSSAGNADRVTSTYTGPAGQGVDFAAGFDPANYPTTIAGTFPTANVFFASNLTSPTTREATLSLARDFEHGVWARGRYVYRRATDFVEDYITIDNGKTTIIRNGVNFGTFDNAVYRNSDLPKRQYDALDVQSGWTRKSVMVSGQWTVQLHDNGNFEGEAANNPAVPSIIADYPEIYVARDYPTGRLDDFQRHKVRLWGVYGLDLGRAGHVDLAPMYRYNSAKTFSYTATVAMSAAQLAANPGYARVPTSQTLYFGDRGAGTFAGYGLVDLASTYQIPVWRSLSPWFKVEVLNLMNNQKLISWDTSVTADTKGPLDANGLPLNYITGPNFGKATSNANYPRPRQGMDGGRTYLMSFGVRF